jgi:hypothetical protein
MVTRTRYLHVPALLAVCVLGTGLSGCGDESGTPVGRPGNTLVFEGRGRLQCVFTGGITPEQSAMKLIREGVDVLRSGCGAMTDVAFATVCGGPSGELVLHEIRTANLDTAERAGFRPVADLKTRSGGQGYAWVDCETGNALP